MIRTLFVVIAACGAAVLSGCSGAARPGWIGNQHAEIDASAEDVRQRDDIDRALAALSARDATRPLDVLVLSGGGQTGAFGAGIVEGWTLTGQRPDFGLITGVSTGALISVFAFLGPEGDAPLRELYTTHGKSDVYSTRWWVELPFADSYARSSPLRATIARYITDDVVRRVGEQGARGRILLTATANLDLDRLRIWNMSALAADESIPLHERADRFRNILFAATSIPTFVSPVFIDRSMHADAGPIRQLFLTDRAHAEDFRRQLAAAPLRIWVVVNRTITSPPAITDDHIFAITARSVQLMIDACLEKDIEEVRRLAADCNASFFLAAVPENPLNRNPADMFDRSYMQELNGLGRAMVQSGAVWSESPADHKPP